MHYSLWATYYTVNEFIALDVDKRFKLISCSSDVELYKFVHVCGIQLPSQSAIYLKSLISPGEVLQAH